MSWSLKHDIDHSETIDGITYRVAKTKQDADQVVAIFIDYLMKDEPMALGRGLVMDRPSGVVKQIEDLVRDGVTLMAVDDVTGRVVGMRAGCVAYRGKTQAERDSLEALEAQFPVDYARIVYLCSVFVWAHDVFEAHPEDNVVYDMWGLCTHPDYRGRGIAQQLLQQAFKVARKAGCNSAIVAASSDISRHIFYKIGMEQFGHIDLKEYEIDGHKYFANTPSQGLSAHYLKL